MFLDYHDEPPALWPKLLESLRAEGTSVVRSRVCWGAHEQVRGIRDFSKSSRLRLEKFLRLAHSLGLSLEIILGFPPGKDAFPPWAYGQTKKSHVPAGLWEGGDTNYAQSPIPSIYDPEVREAFLDFLGEVAPLLALYRKPEGPLSGVYLDLGLFEHDLSANETPEFAVQLERRYPGLDSLNSVYRSSFRDYRAPLSHHGLRVLSDRRPWLAAFDYQWCRRELLKDVRSRVPDLPSPPLPVRPAGAGTWQLAVDAVLFEVAEERPFPLVLGGQPNPSSISGFRMAEYLKDRALESGVDIAWLGVEPREGALYAERVYVICGKYLSRAAYDALERHAGRGAKVIFVTGAPHYDENLQSFPSRPFAPSLSVDDELWDKLTALAEAKC